MPGEEDHKTTLYLNMQRNANVSVTLKCDPRGRIAAYDQTSHELLDDDLRLDFQFGPILGNIYVHTVFVSVSRFLKNLVGHVGCIISSLPHGLINFKA